MLRKTTLAMVSAVSLVLGTAGEARASLVSAFQFNGTGDWSIDAVGGNNTPVGTLSAVVPAGSTVVKAFLYSSLYSLSGPISTPTVNFDGTVLGGGNFTSLGSYQPQPGPNPNFWLGAYRADVTSQVAAKIGGGGAVPFNFVVQSETPTTNIDGEVLAVIYSNPAGPTRTIAFLDGFSSSTGDTTTVNFASPLTQGQLDDPAFQALMSLGIGFSAGGSQFSSVDINVAGNRLTSSAGGFDDGAAVNGGLITAGDLGDNPANPADPNSTTSPDDELYTLKPFLTAGMTGFNTLTRNPSLDDNIFFAGLNLTAQANINNNVPEPGTLLLLSFALAGLGFTRRRRLR